MSQGIPRGLKAWLRRYPLSAALRYRNPEVIHRFMADHPDSGISRAEAEAIFLETKRWLWFCAYYQRYFRGKRRPFAQFPLLDEMIAIDDMWHAFILFTQDYRAFCEERTGGFIHHHPTPLREKKARERSIRRDPKGAALAKLAYLAKVSYWVSRLMGPPTAQRWYRLPPPEPFEVP